MTTETKPVGPVHQKLPSGLMWLVAAAVITAFAVVVFTILTADSTPTVTFDGQAAVYDGPATLDAGEHTFVFDGSAYETESEFAFSLSVIKDPTITDADIEAYEVESSYTLPPFIGRSKIFWVLENAEDRILEETFQLEPGTRYGIFVHPRGGDNLTYFAATIEVE